MKLYIHIGSDKCGSTSMQTSWYLNREILASQGIYLPKTGLGHNNGHARVFMDESGELLSALVDELKSVESEYKTAVIGWEGVHFISERDLKRNYRALQQFDAVAIFYVRDQGEVIQTGILQQWRTGNCGLLFEKRMPDHRLYFKTAEKWSNFLGQKTQVAIFDRALLPEGDVVSDFYSRIGLENPSALKDIGDDVNDSLAFESAYLISMLNRLFPLDELERKYLVDAFLMVQKDFKLTKYFLSEEEVNYIRDYYAETNHALEKEYELSPVRSDSTCWNNDESRMNLHEDLLCRALEFYDIPVIMGQRIFGLKLKKFLKSGWMEVEDWGTWASGDQSVVKFRLMERTIGNINRKVEAISFTIKGSYIGKVEKKSGLRVNGGEHKKVDLSDYTFNLPLNEIPSDGVIELINDHYEKKSPYNAGINSDQRELSFGIESVTMNKIRGPDFIAKPWIPEDIPNNKYRWSLNGILYAARQRLKKRIK